MCLCSFLWIYCIDNLGCSILENCSGKTNSLKLTKITHPQTPSQNNESIITRFLWGSWRRTDERLQNPKTLLESMRRCFCSNYAEPSGDVTQICPQAVIVNLSCTLCDMRRDKLKLWVVPLIKLLSSCRLAWEKFISSIFGERGAKLKTKWCPSVTLCFIFLSIISFVPPNFLICNVVFIHFLSETSAFKVSMIHPLGNMTLTTNLHGNPSYNFWDIPGWIEVVDRLTEQRSHAWLKESWSPEDEPYRSSDVCSSATMRFTFVF